MDHGAVLEDETPTDEPSLDALKGAVPKVIDQAPDRHCHRGNLLGERPDGSVKVMGKGAKERIVPIGTTARGAIVRYLGQRGPAAPDAPLFLGRRGALDWRGMQQVLKRLKARAGISGRCSPHSLRHTFARSHLVNGGDAFSLQRILGHTTLDMVKRYVSLAAFEIVRRFHAGASPCGPVAHRPQGVGSPASGRLPPAQRDGRPDAPDCGAARCCRR